ncbi:MAG TPA: class I SAM-dependent methyltransferase [Smithella sp.]|nr:class I SAM-dependent methyltransferase [Smithella sp.]
MIDTKRNFDKDAALWDENPGRVKMVQRIFDTITSEINLTSSMDVLDFGCGTGLLTMRMAPLVRSITGIDTSQGMLDVLNAKISDGHLAHVKTRFVDLEKGGALKGRYHLITSSMTFHHIKNIGQVLDQFYKVLLPEGKICIADLDSDDGEFHENNEGVFHFGFEREHLSLLIQKAGFKDIKCLTAARITKPVSGRAARVFTIFLITGRKL